VNQSRKEIRKKLEKVANREEMRMIMLPPVFKGFDKPIMVEGEKNVKFETNQYVRVTVNNTNSIIPSELHKTLLERTKLILEYQYGEKNVRLDPDNYLFTVMYIETIIANYDEKSKHWKFTAFAVNGKTNDKIVIPGRLFE
jgi:nickel-dependent lactate racemase